MAAYSPPFTLTHAMLSWVAEIAELVGQWRFAQSSQVPMLRRENRIRTIQASLAIEHNTLSVEQVTAVIEGMAAVYSHGRSAGRCHRHPGSLGVVGLRRVVWHSGVVALAAWHRTGSVSARIRRAWVWLAEGGGTWAVRREVGEGTCERYYERVL